MQDKARRFIAITLVPGVMLAVSSCSSPPRGESRTSVSTQEGVPDRIQVETYEITAKGTSTNAANRHVTLVTRDGVEILLTVGPEVVTSGQLQVGDQVKAVALRQLVVFMRERGVCSSDGGSTAIVLAPVGAKPGGGVVNTLEVTGTRFCT